MYAAIRKFLNHFFKRKALIYKPSIYDAAHIGFSLRW